MAQETGAGEANGLTRRTVGFERGFTLVELLVAISIIAVLLAILLPVLTTARDSGREVACQVNHRQLMQAQFAYADDYERMTSVWKKDVPISWRARLAEYVSGAREDDLASVLHCTNLDRQEFRERPPDSKRGRYAASIGLNGSMLFPEWSHRTDNVPEPSRTITLGEQPVSIQETLYSYDGYAVYSDHSGGFQFWILSLNHAPQRGFRHGSEPGANFAFADGHVERLGSEALHRTSGHWHWFDGLAYPTAILVGGCSCPLP